MVICQTLCAVAMAAAVAVGGGANAFAQAGPPPAAWSASDCATCHEKGRQVNWNGGLHERRGTGCTSCHGVHDFKSVRAPLKTVRDSETCFTCHKQMRAKIQRTSHHPVRESKMDCSGCHDPHDSTRPKMVSATSVNDKCYECHTEKRGPFMWEHAPVRESCVNCHATIHGTNAPSGVVFGR